MQIQRLSWAVWAIALLVLFPTTLRASIVFERTYGGWDVDEGYCVQQTSDGGYILAGFTQSFGAGRKDVYLVKTDSLGDTLWTKVYGGEYWDKGRHVEQTSDGGYIIVGGTYSYGAGDCDVWLLKTDSLGDTIWTRTYGDWGHDQGMCVRQTPDGGYIVVGTFSPQASYGDVYILKTDSLGDTLWARTYGEMNVDEWGSSVQATADGGYIIVGGKGGAVRDLYLLKVDSQGDTVWTRTYGGGGDEWGACVECTNDGNYIIAGGTHSYGAGYSDIWLMKVDPSGDTLWANTFGGSSYEWGYSVQQTSDFGYIITGCTESFGAGGEDVYLVKTDPGGNTLWTRTYGGGGWDRGYFVRQTSDLGYVILGYTGSFGAGGSDFYLIKTSPAGNVGVEDTTWQSLPDGFYLGQNYPNPFNSVTTIPYRLTTVHGQPTAVSLRVYNLLGQKVRTLVDGLQKPGWYTLTWDGKDEHGMDLPSGIYFCRLKGRGFLSTRRILILR